MIHELFKESRADFWLSRYKIATKKSKVTFAEDLEVHCDENVEIHPVVETRSKKLTKSSSKNKAKLKFLLNKSNAFAEIQNLTSEIRSFFITSDTDKLQAIGNYTVSIEMLLKDISNVTNNLNSANDEFSLNFKKDLIKNIKQNFKIIVEYIDKDIQVRKATCEADLKQWKMVIGFCVVLISITFIATTKRSFFPKP